LTYATEHLPKNGSLNKRDLQNFKKLLRKRYSGFDPVPGYKYPGNQNVLKNNNQPKKHPIRTQDAGEYGEKNGRPHYHMIVLNWAPSKYDLGEPLKSEGGEVRRSQLLEELWGKGHVYVAEVNKQTIGYVSRYVMKKQNGQQKEQHYRRIDPITGEIYHLVPEYATYSTKPALGIPYMIANPQYFEKDDIYVHTESYEGFKAKLPRAYLEHIGKTNEKFVEDAKLARKKFMLQDMKDRPEEYTPARRAARAECFREKTKSLKRSYG